ncbi:MAG TPA: SulP family inorganic anion transporter [Candidatus Saccharimonadales bacterium]|nr:SulP family inorganic anion transporter [Candidatus Saccharimonadales bacterium]
MQQLKHLLLPSFKGYKKKWLKSDLMAALVVTAIAIPESLGFAIIVGLPVQAGLYCALLAPIIFAIFTSSKHLVIGADSATAALVAAGGAAVAAAGTSEYSNAIAVLGLVTALVLFAMSAARLGFLADLISKPVLIGFISGVGVQLLIGKLPEMLGLHASGGLFDKLSFLASNIQHAELAPAILSAAIVTIVILGWKLRWPGALIGLGLAIIATKLFSLHDLGIEVVGSVPQGLPAFHVPHISWDVVTEVLPVALSIAIVILAQSLAVIRNSAAKHEEKVDDNKDLFALGMANGASALVGGFAVNGSPPRTSAGEMAGGRSQLVNVIMALLIGLVLLFATGLFEYVPSAALAAIVFTIGLHLVKFHDLKDIFIVRQGEFTVALAALSAVALLGVQKGVMIAVALSLVERLRRQYRPSDELLLHDQKFADWANDRLRGSHRKQFNAPPGLLVYRFNESLFFENAGYFLERATDAVASTKEQVIYFVLDAGAINDVDYTASKTLRQLYNQLSSDDVQLAIAHVSPKLRSLLKRYGLVELIGAEHIYPSVRTAIDSYTRTHVSSAYRIHTLGLPKTEYVVISGSALELMGIRQTNDVDLVVSKKAYDELRDNKWKEYVLDDGKKILSQHGYKIMLRWMGHDLARLKKTAQTIEGIPVMGLDDLIDCKTQMGRKKDIEDIKLIRKHKKAQKESGKA